MTKRYTDQLQHFLFLTNYKTIQSNESLSLHPKNKTLTHKNSQWSRFLSPFLFLKQKAKYDAN